MFKNYEKEDWMQIISIVVMLNLMILMIGSTIMLIVTQDLLWFIATVIFTAAGLAAKSVEFDFERRFDDDES